MMLFGHRIPTGIGLFWVDLGILGSYLGAPNEGPIVSSEKADAAFEGGIVTTSTRGGKAG